MKLITCLSLAAVVGVAAGCSSYGELNNPYSIADYDNPDNWILASNTDCKVNRVYVPEATEVTWDGPCYQGFAIGKGELNWVQADGSKGVIRSCLQPEHTYSECYTGGGMGGH